jgi:hypothetical protein
MNDDITYNKMFLVSHFAFNKHDKNYLQMIFRILVKIHHEKFVDIKW